MKPVSISQHIAQLTGRFPARIGDRKTAVCLMSEGQTDKRSGLETVLGAHYCCAYFGE